VLSVVVIAQKLTSTAANVIGVQQRLVTMYVPFCKCLSKMTSGTLNLNSVSVIDGMEFSRFCTSIFMKLLYLLIS